MKPSPVDPSQWHSPSLAKPDQIPGQATPNLRPALPGAPATGLRTQLANHTFLWIVAAALVGLALKFTIAMNTLGTEDVLVFYKFGRALTEHGLEWSYMHDKALNHPPLVAYYVRFIYAA